ncbi:MAG: MerR family transcriptional regulator [Syntrophomonadaceae bacterium]|nr:MerR family transcriptional regulator [Syntrophomonadaceae bacterium]
MANLRNCSQCGKLFPYQGRNICGKCLEKEEDDFQLVRKYVRDHPGAGVIEVAEETKVEEDKILQFLRDGRLQSKGLTTSLVCERCGIVISTGRWCEKCTKQVKAEIQGAAPSKPASQAEPAPSKTRGKDRMHVKGD